VLDTGKDEGTATDERFSTACCLSSDH